MSWLNRLGCRYSESGGNGMTGLRVSGVLIGKNIKSTWLEAKREKWRKFSEKFLVSLENQRERPSSGLSSRQNKRVGPIFFLASLGSKPA